MSASFDFSAWLAATGWSNAEAGRQIGRTREQVSRMAAGKDVVTDHTVNLCREATRKQIERLEQFASWEAETMPNFHEDASDSEIVAWALKAAEADRQAGMRYRKPEEDAAISIRAISLMADPRINQRSPLGVGTTLTMVDRICRQQGFPVRSALLEIVRSAPEIAADAARLYALRRPVDAAVQA